MSESKDKFTPGPWEIKFGGQDDSDGFCIVSTVQPGVVAENWPCGMVAGDRIHVNANAKLIAAAPDLLAFARMALQPERDAYDQYDDWHEKLKTSARKVIAQATRQEQP